MEVIKLRITLLNHYFTNFVKSRFYVFYFHVITNSYTANYSCFMEEETKTETSLDDLFKITQ